MAGAKRMRSTEGDTSPLSKKSKSNEENNHNLNTGAASSSSPNSSSSSSSSNTETQESNVALEGEGKGNAGTENTANYLESEKDEVEDKTHFGARTEFSISTVVLPWDTDIAGKIRVAFSKNEEGVTGVETLCERVTEDKSGKVVACMKTLVVYRDRQTFKANFVRRMNDASSISSELAEELFDRKGNAKPYFINHPIRKGSGVWGKEIQKGTTVIIDSIDVAGKRMRKGVATFMWKVLMRVLELKKVKWVFVSPVPMRRFETLEAYHRKVDISFAFWRSLGFRRVGLSGWFCYATDSNHASRSLPIGDDVDPPRDGLEGEEYEEYPDRGLFLNPYQKVREKMPLQYAVTSMPDPEFYPFLNKELATHSASDSHWAIPDNKGNTFLHIAAVEGRSECVRWVRTNLGRVLDNTRNNRGCTALEELEERVEDMQTYSQIGDYRMDVSDKSRVIPTEFIICRTILQHTGQNIL